MIWLTALVVLGGLAFVMFRKPELKTMGVGWVPPEQRNPQLPSSTAKPPSDV